MSDTNFGSGSNTVGNQAQYYLPNLGLLSHYQKLTAPGKHFVIGRSAKSFCATGIRTKGYGDFLQIALEHRTAKTPKIAQSHVHFHFHFLEQVENYNMDITSEFRKLSMLVLRGPNIDWVIASPQ